MITISIHCLLKGGTEFQTLHLVRALVNLNQSVSVVFYCEYESEMVKEFEEKIREKSSRTLYLVLPKAFRLVKELIKYFLTRLTYNRLIDRIPLKPPDEFFVNTDSILIVAPHPDDEIIGVGGLIIEAIKRGCIVNVLFLTDGEGSGAHPNKDRVAEARKKLTKNVFQKLGLGEENVIRLSLEDGNIPHKNEEGYQEALRRINDVIESVNPDKILAAHYQDYWPFDHVACSELLADWVDQSSADTELFYYWVWAWFHIKPWNVSKIDTQNIRKIHIKEHITLKQELIRDYTLPCSEMGKPWSGKLPAAMLYPFTKPYEIIEHYAS